MGLIFFNFYGFYEELANWLVITVLDNSHN